MKEYSLEQVRALLPLRVQVTREEWFDCRSFSGAVQKYLPDALKLWQLNERRKVAQLEVERLRLLDQQVLAQQQQEERRQADMWNALAGEQQKAIRRLVVDRLGGVLAPESFVRRLCLEEVGKKA